MAFVPMTAGSVGSMTETLLWQNSSPTASFASQAVTLSDDIDKYAYIAIEYRASTTNSDKYKVYYKPSELSNYKSNVGRPLVGMRHTNDYYYYRMLQYNNGSSLTFGDCVRNTASSTAGVNNVGVIPLAISGITIVDYVPSMAESTLWVNSSPTSDFASQHVTLSDNISNYDYIVIESRFSKTEDTRTKYIYKTSEFSNCITGSLYPMPYLGNYYNNYYFYRLYAYIDDTTISFGTCKRNTASGSASNYNSACIPVSVKGIKLGNNNTTVNLNLLNPAIYRQTNIATLTNLSIPVTQLPRYIILSYSKASSATDRSGLEVYDCVNEHHKSWRYTESGYLVYVDDASATDISSVTSSAVTIYNSHSWTARFEILIYY